MNILEQICLVKKLLLQYNLDIYKLLKYCNIKRNELNWKKEE